MKTSIIIDDDLMKRALRVSGFKTKSELIQAAVEEFVENHEPKEMKEPKNFLDLFGTNFIDEDYDYKALRRNRNFDIIAEVIPELKIYEE